MKALMSLVLAWAILTSCGAGQLIHRACDQVRTLPAILDQAVK